MSNQETIGARIRAVRVSQRLKSRQLAERAGLHPSTLSQIENGRRIPDTTSLESLARVLGKTTSELMDGASLKIGGPPERGKSATADSDIIETTPAQLSETVQAAIRIAVADLLATLAAAIGDWHATHVTGEMHTPQSGTAHVPRAHRR